VGGAAAAGKRAAQAEAAEAMAGEVRTMGIAADGAGQIDRGLGLYSLSCWITLRRIPHQISVEGTITSSAISQIGGVFSASPIIGWAQARKRLCVSGV